MPSRTTSEPPQAKMSDIKTVFFLALAVIFDGLKAIFEMFGIFGPVFVGIATQAAVGGVTGFIAGFFFGGASFLFPPAFELFGLIMAMAVGLLGGCFSGYSSLSRE